jgi:DnaJ-class molecular chaperone
MANCNEEFNPDFLFGDDICSTCGGNGKVMLNEDGQTYEETINTWNWTSQNCEICPDCQGSGKHLNMGE